MNDASDQEDWTVDPATGRANSSEAFCELEKFVADIVRNSAHDLLTHGPHVVARLVVAKLAHEKGMRPHAAGGTT